ncbi:hypothetical protein GCM10009808_16220 [Microbacterium sediminicola]|uniref:Thiol reductant ABC exporter subunit CydD n=1 Tax=Microbacterium sediminicola TaxID=415210 RepID=A0ABN2I679_9MICO
MPSADESPARRPPVDPRLLRYARGSRGFFALIAVIGLAQTLAIIAFAWLLTQGIVRAVDGDPAGALSQVLPAFAAVVLARALLMWAREAAASRAAARVESELRSHLLDAVGRLGPDWLATRSTAHLAVTAGRGLDALDAYFGRYLPQLLLTAIATPIIIAVMWWQDWLSGLTVVLTIPLIPIFMVLIGLMTRAVQQRQWQTLGQLASRISDTVRGLSTLKVFGRQHRAAASIATVTEQYRRETMKVLRVSFISGFMLEFLASIAVAIVAVSIGFRLLDGSLALSVGLFVLLLAPEAYLPLRQVGVQFHAAAEGVAATDDIFDVLDAARDRTAPGLSREGTQHAVRHDPDATDRDPSLVASGVRVRRGESLLAPVTFEAGAGSVTLIEGPSGVGKSSLFAALRGAASFEGTLTHAGVDVSTLTPATWLAWAGQRPGLITGTISDNIALGADAADASLVARALALACADELHPELLLGAQGSGLSGGQAQRVAIARAFYRHLAGAASVIALDEPSSALDAATEARLWSSVRLLADDGATVLLVSHRRSARSIADRIVSLEPSEVRA